MDHQQREIAVQELQELLDNLASEAMHKAREMGKLQAQMETLTKDLEHNWDAIQDIRKKLVTRHDLYLTPIPVPRGDK